MNFANDVLLRIKNTAKALKRRWRNLEKKSLQRRSLTFFQNNDSSLANNGQMDHASPRQYCLKLSDVNWFSSAWRSTIFASNATVFALICSIDLTVISSKYVTTILLKLLLCFPAISFPRPIIIELLSDESSYFLGDVSRAQVERRCWSKWLI